jgi:hypothetical protein
MKFYPSKSPFPYWTGPYSPARGKSGFRVKNGKLGAWVSSEEGRSFCIALETDGISNLAEFVTSNWQGGRLLFLPNGIIVKPLQNEKDAGMRVIVGRYEGGLKLISESGEIDLSVSSYSSGSEWPGPSTIGLECTIKTDGSLVTSWQQPSEYGSEKYSEKITSANPGLIAGFKKARPYDNGGRVRVTVCGHVITNKETNDGWKSFYVGQAHTDEFSKWDKWIQTRSK